MKVDSRTTGKWMTSDKSINSNQLKQIKEGEEPIQNYHNQEAEELFDKICK